MVFSTEDRILIKALRPVNSLDLNPIDYRIWEKLQQHVYQNGFVTWIRWSHARSKSGNNSSSQSSTKRSNSGVSVFKPAFEHEEDISNFRQAYCSIFLQRYSFNS